MDQGNHLRRGTPGTILAPARPPSTRRAIEEMRHRALTPADVSTVLTTQINYTDSDAGGAGVGVAAHVALFGGVGFADGDWSGLWITNFKPNASGVWNSKLRRRRQRRLLYRSNNDGVFQ